MPIIIRHNGALNALTEGLEKGFKEGKALQAQQAAIDEAKERRKLEQRRVEMAESQQTLAQTLAKSEEEFNVSQRAYTKTAQGQAQEDRKRALGERQAAQQGNAMALGRVQESDPARLGLGKAMVEGGAQGGPLGAALSGAMFTAEDQAAMQEAQAVARQMDPERGRQYVQDEEKRNKGARSEALRPKLLKAWQETLKQATTADPEDPAASVVADPKIVSRAQTAIAGLQSGADPEQFLQQFQVQQQDIAEQRKHARLKKTYTDLITNNIARVQEMGMTNPEFSEDAIDRADEAQTYLDQMNDPDLEPRDVRDLGTKALAALHGRGSSSTAAKKQRSIYSEARKMAQADVQSMLLTGPAAEKALDALTQKHMQTLRDEAGLTAPAAQGVQRQGVVPPGTGGASGDAPAGAQGSQAPVIPGTPEEAAQAEPAVRVQAVQQAQQKLVQARRALEQLPDGADKTAALAKLKEEAAKWLAVQGNDPNAPAPGTEAAPAAPKTRPARRPLDDR